MSTFPSLNIEKLRNDTIKKLEKEKQDKINREKQQQKQYDYQNYLNYEIQQGDVISEIAIRFGVTVDTINKTNNLKNKSIFPGQVIRIDI